MVETRPAATLIVARETGPDIEVFLLRRSSRSTFMPDVFVFPGGAVDALDGSAVALARIRGATLVSEPAYLYAAVRETFEEAGLLFATDAMDQTTLLAARRSMLAQERTFDQILTDLTTHVDAAALRYFSRWITPPSELRRFDTHFFVARAPTGQIARADAGETHDGIWISPTVALAKYTAGRFALILPTIAHLQQLRGFSNVTDLLAYAARKTIRPVMPDMLPDRTFCVPPALEGIW